MTKPCAQFRESISLLASGDLEASERPAVHAHLLACAGCARHWSDLSATIADHRAAAKSLDKLHADAGFHARLQQRVVKTEPKRLAAPDSIRLLRWCGAGAIAASIVLAMLLWPGEEAPPERQTSGEDAPAWEPSESIGAREPTLAKYSGSLHPSIEQFDVLLNEDAERWLSSSDRDYRMRSASIE